MSCFRRFWLAFVMLIPAPELGAQVAELAGTLHAVWRDAVDGRATTERRYSIVGTDGTTTAVEIPASVAAAHGGHDALDRQRVRVAVAGGRVTAIRAVEAGDARGLGARLLASVAEPKPFVTLLCVFPDFAEIIPTTLTAARRAMGSTYPGAAHYWDEVSNGAISMAGNTVHGWYTLPSPKSAYVLGSDANTTLIARDCAAAADADVYFPDFAGVNFVLNTDIGCCLWGGSGGLSLDGGPRSYGMTWLSGDALRNLGQAMHEMGHAMGLGHSSGPYGLVYDSRWDVMSSSAWHQPPGEQFLLGAHINAYGKRRLGWIPDARHFEAAPGSHSILIESTAQPAENGAYLMARIPTPVFGAQQYYTLEARGVSGYDAPLPGAGIVIHRVGGGGATASNVVDPDGNYETSDLGAVLAPGELFEDRVNGITISVAQREGNAFRVNLAVGEYPRLAVMGPARTLQAVAGAGTAVPDSSSLTVGGVPSGTPWRAHSLYPGPLALQTTSGTGDAMLRWTTNTAGLGPGLYYQEIRVEIGAGQWPQATASIALQVRVDSAATLTAGLSQTSAHDSTVVGGTRPSALYVRVSGPGASNAAWTASSTAPWIRVDSVSGTGNRLLVYTRLATGLAPGLHVGTVIVDVPQAVPSRIVVTDTLRVLEAPTWAITARGASRTSMVQGAAPRLDSVYVELGGRWGTGADWYGFQSAGTFYALPEPPPPRGSGWFRFTRAPRDLAPGVYPASVGLTLAFNVGTPPLEFADTLVVVAAPSALVLSKSVARDAVVGTNSISEDSVWVQPQGPSSSSRVWSVSAPPTRLAFPIIPGSGIPTQRTGPSWIRWIRNLAGRTPGWHVDTVRFSFDVGSGTPAELIDSLFVSSAPLPTTVALGTLARRSDLQAGAPGAVADSVPVTLTGTSAGSVNWSASTSAPWITLTTANGTGSGMLRWTRSAQALAPGMHVDTIRVTASAVGSPIRFVDSLRVYAPLVVTSVPQRPPAQMGSAYADQLAVSEGPGGAVTWSVVAGSLPAGLSLAAGTGALAGVPEASGDFAFTVRAQAGTSTADRALTLQVTEPTLVAGAVIDHLLGGAQLGEDLRRYLDLVGNRNGRTDIGDVRAWRVRVAATLTAADRQALDSLSAPRRTP